jgi:hypothetical protein
MRSDRARRVALASSLALSIAAPRAALAADETLACLSASEAGQRLRDDGKLLEAREQFATCSRDVCPRPVRKDCLQWTEELKASLSSVVLGARDRAGHEVVDVRASVDGRLVASALDGKAIFVDPGPHKVRFEWARGGSLEIDLVAREGERNRIVTVDLPGQEKDRATPPAPVTASPRPERSSSRRTAAFLVGGAGLVALGVGAYFGARAISRRAESDKECPNENCSAKGVSLNDQAIGAAWVSDIALGLGVVGAAIGVYLFLTSREEATGVRVAARGLTGRF